MLFSSCRMAWANTAMVPKAANGPSITKAVFEMATNPSEDLASPRNALINARSSSVFITRLWHSSADWFSMNCSCMRRPSVVRMVVLHDGQFVGSVRCGPRVVG